MGNRTRCAGGPVDGDVRVAADRVGVVVGGGCLLAVGVADRQRMPSGALGLDCQGERVAGPGADAVDRLAAGGVRVVRHLCGAGQDAVLGGVRRRWAAVRWTGRPQPVDHQQLRRPGDRDLVDAAGQEQRDGACARRRPTSSPLTVSTPSPGPSTSMVSVASPSSAACAQKVTVPPRGARRHRGPMRRVGVADPGPAPSAAYSASYTAVRSSRRTRSSLSTTASPLVVTRGRGPVRRG